MSDARLVAESRTEFGKGYARRARKAGRVPAVIYGHGSPVRHVSLPARELGFALRGGGSNVLLTIELDGDSELALPRQIVRHPIKGHYEHVDLLLVRRGETVSVDLPLHLIGVDTVKEGVVDAPHASLAVTADATNIPTSLEVDVTGMQVGTAIHAGDLTLPDGVTLAGDPEALVVHIVAQRGQEEPETTPAVSTSETPAGTDAEAPAEGSES